MILVTGASRGLGKYLFQKLKRNYNIHGTTRNKSKFFFKNSIYNNFDLNDDSKLELLEKRLSKYDCIINNIGIAYDGLLATQGVTSIKNVINTNLTQNIILTKMYVRARLQKNKGGNIINISSICSVKAFKGLVTYGASKAGINSMTESLAKEIGPINFRVNSILPGYFKTDMSSKIGVENLDKIKKRTPLKKLTEKKDILNLVEFLISKKSNQITGQNIIVDGGFTL
jgi:3-oxoacyl-[acyl-carrier protein] reductase